MNLEYVQSGAPVVTAPRLEGIAGTGITAEQRQNRQPATLGVVQDMIREQQAEVWLVRHNDGKVAAYHHDEILPLSNNSMPQGFRPS